jgi:hypothetical protein
MLYTNLVKLFAEVPELFSVPYFSSSSTKWLSWSASFRGPKKWKSVGAKLGL